MDDHQLYSLRTRLHDVLWDVGWLFSIDNILPNSNVYRLSGMVVMAARRRIQQWWRLAAQRRGESARHD